MLPGLYFGVVPDSIDALLNDPPPKPLLRGLFRLGARPAAAESSTAAIGCRRCRSRRGFPEDTSRLWQDMVRRASACDADAASLR